MFIINYEDITETATKNELKKFTNNRHRSFKLRLPSIRRDIRTRVKSASERTQQQQTGDPENPPQSEEAVPLNSMTQGAEDSDREAFGIEGAYSVQSRLPATHESIKEEEEGEDGEDNSRNNNELSGEDRTFNEEKDMLFSMVRDGADVDRGDFRDGGGGGESVSLDNMDIATNVLPNGRPRAHTLGSSCPTVSNHIKSNFVNQASSDSELHRQRLRPLADSLSNLAEAGGKKGDKDGVVATRGIILPNVANMKQNVSEKVAQLWLPGVSKMHTESFTFRRHPIGRDA